MKRGFQSTKYLVIPSTHAKQLQKKRKKEKYNENKIGV